MKSFKWGKCVEKFGSLKYRFSLSRGSLKGATYCKICLRCVYWPLLHPPIAAEHNNDGRMPDSPYRSTQGTLSRTHVLVPFLVGSWFQRVDVVFRHGDSRVDRTVGLRGYSVLMQHFTFRTPGHQDQGRGVI